MNDVTCERYIIYPDEQKQTQPSIREVGVSIAKIIFFYGSIVLKTINTSLCFREGKTINDSHSTYIILI